MAASQCRLKRDPYQPPNHGTAEGLKRPQSSQWGETPTLNCPVKGGSPVLIEKMQHTAHCPSHWQNGVCAADMGGGGYKRHLTAVPTRSPQPKAKAARRQSCKQCKPTQPVRKVEKGWEGRVICRSCLPSVGPHGGCC